MNKKYYYLTIIIFLLLIIFTRVRAETYNLQLQSGWNMVSLPLNTTLTKDSISSKCSLASSIYHYNPVSKNYEVVTSLTPGLGYWINVKSACTLTLTGNKVNIDSSPVLKAGTNQIGSFYDQADFSLMRGNCNILNGPVRYNTITDQYEGVSVLEPGLGYFIKVGGDCSLRTILSATILEQHPDVAVTNVALQKTVVGQSYSLNINVTVVNQYMVANQNTETFNVTVYANTIIIETKEVTLTSGNSSTITFTWNTTGFDYGNYTINAYAWPVPGEIEKENNNYICATPVHIGVPGDVSGTTPGAYDGITNTKDVAYMVALFNTRPNSPNWDPNADVNNDGVCNIQDIAIAVANFNKRENPGVIQHCSDGTAYGQCSVTQPKYCDNGTLINKCSQCGCSSGYTCQSDGSCLSSCNNVGLGTPSVNPSTPTANQQFQILCPAAQAGVDCISVYANDLSNECTFSQWSGSNAVFNCSGLAQGTYTARCVSGTGTSSNCCSDAKTSTYTITTQQCSDGTSYGSCSVTQPKYCDNGTLINKCSLCGCLTGYTCQSDGSCAVSTCDSTCKAQNFASGSCRTGSSGSNTNLAAFPDSWLTQNTGMNQWGYPSAYTYLDSVINGKQAIELDHNPNKNPGGVVVEPDDRELDGKWTSIKPGDHIVYSAWFLTEPSSFVDTGAQAYRSGAVLGLDFYAAGRICEISTPTGLTSYPNYPASMAQCHVPWGTGVWTKVTIDFVVQDSYEADPWGGYYSAGQMVTPTGFIPWVIDVSSNPSSQYAKMWVTDTELYINPTSTATCQSGETLIEDSCSSNNLCCCSGTASTPQFKILRNGWEISSWSAQKSASLIDVYNCHYDYLSQARAIKAIRPDILVFLYRNTETVWTSKSQYEYNAQEEALFKANNWLLKDSSGNYVIDEGGSGYLVDFGNPGYQTWLANWYKQYASSIDGVELDNWFCEKVNVFWSVTGGQTPINPRTGVAWTSQNVLDAFKAMVQAVRNALGSGKLILINGAGGGLHFYKQGTQSYYMNAFTTEPVDAVMCEQLLTGSYDASVYYSETDWLDSINLLIWLEKNFIGTAVLQIAQDSSYSDENNHLPTDMTVAQYQQYVTFQYASRLLTVKRLTTYMSFGNYIDQSYPQSLFKIDTGNPLGDYYMISGTHVYTRDFSKAKVLVNPSTSSYTVSLGGSYKTLDGTTVSSITMNPHTGNILLKF